MDSAVFLLRKFFFNIRGKQNAKKKIERQILHLRSLAESVVKWAQPLVEEKIA